MENDVEPATVMRGLSAVALALVVGALAVPLGAWLIMELAFSDGPGVGWRFAFLALLAFAAFGIASIRGHRKAPPPER